MSCAAVTNNITANNDNYPTAREIRQFRNINHFLLK